MSCHSGTKKGKLVLYQMGFGDPYSYPHITSPLLWKIFSLPSFMFLIHTISSLFADFRATKIVVNDGVQCKSILMMRAVSEEI